MESTVKERIIKFIEYKNISKNAFETACNLSKRYISNLKGTPGSRIIRSIKNSFPELNTAWLLTGAGQMIESKNEEENYLLEEIRAPILPTRIAGKPNTDLLDYIKSNQQDLELSRIIILDTPIDMWHMIRDDALSPTFKIGDKIALQAYEKGEENPIPGKIYAVDTLSNGLIIRKLIPCEDGGFIAKSMNEERFPDFIIKDDEIIRIFRIVYLGRSNI